MRETADGDRGDEEEGGGETAMRREREEVTDKSGEQQEDGQRETPAPDDAPFRRERRSDRRREEDKNEFDEAEVVRETESRTRKKRQASEEGNEKRQIELRPLKQEVPQAPAARADANVSKRENVRVRQSSREPPIRGEKELKDTGLSRLGPRDYVSPVSFESHCWNQKELVIHPVPSLALPDLLDVARVSGDRLPALRASLSTQGEAIWDFSPSLRSSSGIVLSSTF
ncbi:hypothetical protein TGRUB_433120 [Toxoplasma gondii RUB]|uniref:Uncharacterized protein n=1 Tax=Toxoplasma gondii RUB TaxID=935652 RepID=A0A086LN65_TOXGO|nr:hypothetical protein TGRUB_433120 [Toxoplasma gondii RUB]